MRTSKSAATRPTSTDPRSMRLTCWPAQTTVIDLTAAPEAVFTVWVPLTRRSGLPGWCGLGLAGDDWQHGNFRRRR